MKTNENIINWIIKKAEREYADDIAIILAYSSFINGTANERSDVDCYFIPKNERGRQFAADFIIDGIGYDIFPMDWERVEDIAELKEILSPLVGDVKILFYSSDEDLHKFRGLQDKMRSNLHDREYDLKIAGGRFASACDLHSKMKCCEHLLEVRTYAGLIIMTLADVVAACNQEYFHYGLKRQFEDLKNFKNIPDQFLEQYQGVIKSDHEGDLIRLCFDMLKSVSVYMGWELILSDSEERSDADQNRNQLDYQQLSGFYEEISSTFNKIYTCCEHDNYILAFLSAVCLQNELREISQEFELVCYDILSSYCYYDLSLLAESTRRAEYDFVQIITNGGGKIKRFADFNEFEAADL